MQRTRTRAPHRSRVVVALAAALALVAVVAGVGARPATAVQPAQPQSYDRIFEVVMENLSYASATSYPGYQALAHQYVSASDSYAASHPSLPNYLDLTGGSTFGISSDCTSCYVQANNLGAQLFKAHVSWGDYSEGVPGKCFLGSYANGYAGKHNPFRYYVDIRRSPRLCAHLLPLTALTKALAFHPTSVPRFDFVTPNLCHDGHDCSPTEAFQWLTGFIGTVTSSKAWTARSLLIVTWDEGDSGDTSQVLPSGKVLGSGGGGRIATLFVSPGATPGGVVAAPVTHESILATVERAFGLPYLLGAKAWATHTITLP